MYDYASIHDYYLSIISMKENGFTLGEISNLYPFEIDIIYMIIESEKQKKRENKK